MTAEDSFKERFAVDHWDKHDKKIQRYDYYDMADFADKFSDQRLKEGLLKFKEWYDKLSPADKCTVWPPAGSGSGTGLYNQSDEQIVDKFLKLIDTINSTVV